VHAVNAIKKLQPEVISRRKKEQEKRNARLIDIDVFAAVIFTKWTYFSRHYLLHYKEIKACHEYVRVISHYHYNRIFKQLILFEISYF